MANRHLSLPLLTAGAVVAAVTAYAFKRKARADAELEQTLHEPEERGKSSGFFARGRVEAELEFSDELTDKTSWLDEGVISEDDTPSLRHGLRLRPPPLMPTPVGDAPLHASVPDRGQVSGERRHDLSSMIGVRALAPDAEAIGQELVDPDAIEVPVGLSADAAFDSQLSKAKLPQPYSTGAALREPLDDSARSIEYEGPPEVSDLDIDFDDLDDLHSRPTPTTVMTKESLPESFEPYDAMTPEEIGTEWLLRATETEGVRTQPIDEITEIPEPRNDAVSEASAMAAQAPSFERRSTDLEDDDIWNSLDYDDEDEATPVTPRSPKRA